MNISFESEGPSVRELGSSGGQNLPPHKPRNILKGIYLEHFLGKNLPTDAKKYLKDGLYGHDVGSAISLVRSTPDDFLGPVAMAAYYLGMPNPAYRELFRIVWLNNSGSLMGALNADFGRARRMIKAARFENPLKGEIQIYRGYSRD